jgi:hypothetical protein
VAGREGDFEKSMKSRWSAEFEEKNKVFRCFLDPFLMAGVYSPRISQPAKRI